jgi:hypothetical protein|tara:strand:- start:432 stop:584 length:153 start_codon:yes stop_codon:yes gene_type:complete
MSKEDIEHPMSDALDSDDEDADWEKLEEDEDISKHTEEDEQQFRRAIDEG